MVNVIVFNWRDVNHPEAGGAEIHLFEMGTRWAKQGHEVTLLCAKPRHQQKLEEINGVRVIRDGGNYSVYMRAVRRYMQQKHEYDVAFESINTVPFYVPLYRRGATVALFYQWTPIELLLRELPPHLAILGFGLEAPTPLVYRNTPMVTISHAAKRHFLTKGFKHEKINVIPPAISDHLRNKAARLERKKFAPVVSYIGRLKQYKGVRDLVVAMAYVIKEIPDAKLIIVGQGSEQSALETLTREMGLEHTVSFLGFVDEETKADVLQQSAIFVYPGLYFDGGWSISCLEAIAFGNVPVVTESLRDMIVEYSESLVIPPNRPRLLASRIISLLRNPNRWLEISNKAKSWYIDYNWDLVAQRTLNVMINAISDGVP